MAALTLLIQPQLLGSETLVSLDSSSQFFPWYAFLGQALREGRLPGWNPANFAGTPFAANPLSGWTYLPAMLLFTFLPLAQAARLYLAFHPLLAGLSTYALARCLGLGRAGALLAGLAYANSSYFQIENACCFAFGSVYAWLPVMVLGAERAVRARDWLSRVAWWGFSGLALSQILAAWLGQGAYYAAMVLGGFLALRTLVVLPEHLCGAPLTRLGWFVAHGVGIFSIGAALDAAGLLPRAEFNALSNLAGGYLGDEASVGGLHPKDWALLATPGSWYVGATVLALAGAAAIVGRGRRFRVLWYFGASSIVALLLTGRVETPLHWLLYHMLPGFARLHPHAPERILTVAYLGPALMAGATLTALGQRRAWSRRFSVWPSIRLLTPAVFILLVAADLNLGGARARADWLLDDPLNGADKLTPIDLGTYYQPDAAAQFLRQRLAESSSRYFGYAPEVNGEAWPYSTRFLDPSTAALEVDNRALWLGLQDIQGYDASHLSSYDAYVAALNGRSQNYHDAEVFEAGLSSPLLDLLNVRYVLVPVDAVPTAGLARFQLVYSDQRVKVLENAAAFPRAWIVHSARVAPAVAALADIASGQVDAHHTVMLEEPPPPLAPDTGAGPDTAIIVDARPDRLVLHTQTDAAGVLVLSEVFYPAWQARVDGQPTALLLADGALRALALPSGEHQVELRFESASLTLGAGISLVAAGLLLVVIGLCARRLQFGAR